MTYASPIQQMANVQGLNELKTDFSPMKKDSMVRVVRDQDIEEELKMERKSVPNSATGVYVLTNESGLRGLWDKLFLSGHPMMGKVISPVKKQQGSDEDDKSKRFYNGGAKGFSEEIF